jgi:hypothetical protein
MIYVGIDDTDIVGSLGTNQLARAILERLGSAGGDAVICRHQLFFDRRVPYTSKNGSASIVLPRADAGSATSLIDTIRDVMREWYVEGSDPGLCLTETVPDAVQAFGRRCQQEVVQQDDARRLAAGLGVHLEGLGGTEQGVIGALAAIGLAASQEDGRVVHRSDWPYPDEFCGAQPVAAVLARGVDEIREMASGAPVMSGAIDIGKHLRPNVRHGRIVLFVAPSEDRSAAAWQAVKLT